jgi:hypothetical protein
MNHAVFPTLSTPLLKDQDISQLRGLVTYRRRYPNRWQLQQTVLKNTSLPRILIGFTVLFLLVLSGQLYSDHQSLEKAKANSYNIGVLFEQIMPQYQAMSLKVVEWSDNSGQPIYAALGSSAKPTVFDLRYLRNFGTAEEGDVITLIWSPKLHWPTQNCPSAWQAPNGLYLNVCGLEPLPKGTTNHELTIGP